MGRAGRRGKLRLAALCAFLGCLNPRPEELPSNGLEGAPGAAAAANPAGSDLATPTAAGTGPATPDLDTADAPAESAEPPADLVPMRQSAPADAGADAAADAGAD